MRRKRLLLAGLLLLALGFLIAILYSLDRGAPPQSAESRPAPPIQEHSSQSDRASREESGIGTTQLPRDPGAADRP